MPIKGITDTESALVSSIGRLRKGDVKTSANKPGEELPYWRFTSDDPEVEAAFTAAYGVEPKVLQVFLPYTRLLDNWDTWKEEWGAGGMKHRCDGETTVVLQLPDGSYSTAPHPCPGGCKQVGRLSVILPDLIMRGHAGVVTMQTHSYHDLASITKSLNWVASRRRDGDLTGIMFNLRREQKTISTPPRNDSTKRNSTKKWLVRIDPAPEWVQVSMRLATSDTVDQKQLAARSVNTETGEITTEPNIAQTMHDARVKQEAEDAAKQKMPKLDPSMKKRFVDYVNELVSQYPQWLNSKKKADFDKIGATLIALKYEEIDPANIANAFQSLQLVSDGTSVEAILACEQDDDVIEGEVTEVTTPPADGDDIPF